MSADRYERAGQAIQKCSSGEPITDEELYSGVVVLRNEVLPALRAMGDCYYLAYSDLNAKLELLIDFHEARKRGC